MHEHYGFAPVELFEHGIEGRIAEPFGSGRVAIVRDDSDPARLQHVERIFDLAQAAVCVRQRDDRKQPEASWVATSKVGRIVITKS